MSHKALIDENEVRKAWEEENLTQNEMAERFHVSSGTIQNYARRFGLSKTKEQKSAAIKRTVMLKYGVENPGQSPEVKDKIRKTFLEKYGETSPLKTEAVRQKIKKTCLERYGVESIGSSPEIRQKIESTCVEKYGSKTCLVNPVILAKTQKTLMDKYGVLNSGCAKEVRRKMEETCLARYGVKSTLLEPNTRHKIRETMKARYGVETVSQIGYDELTIKVMGSADEMRKYIESAPDKTTIGLTKGLKCKSCAFLRQAHNFGLFDLIEHFRSAKENDLYDWIVSLGFDCKVSVKDVIPYGELDIYIPSRNLAIEFNGNYWHCSLKKDKNYHLRKSNECAKRGIRLIHVYEYEWDDDRTRPIVESIIKGALGLYETRIYARDCEIRNLSSQESAEFLNKHHLQGYRSAKMSLGLFYEGALVQMMSFSHNGHYQNWEIIRSCTQQNTVVIGGLSKLLCHFKTKVVPKEIFSYCDYNKYTGSGYEALGMEMVGFTGPDLKWYMSDGAVISRSPHRNKELSESAVAKIWGAGSKKYLLKC